MRIPKRALAALIALALLSQAAPAVAQPWPQGLADAEEAHDWDKAVALCREALAKNPKRADLWGRIADIESSRNRPKEAKKAVEKALEVKPGDTALLRKHVELSKWAGDNAGAEKSLRALLKQNPHDYKNMFELGQILSWDGKTAESIRVLEPYVARESKDARALLLLSQNYRWNGDTAKASATLERYREIAGETAAYKKEHMQLLSADSRSRETVAAANEVLKDNPRDCDALTSKATAFGSSRQPTHMLESLSGVSLYCKDKEAAGKLNRQLTTPLRDFARARYDYSTDSDTIRISTVTVDGRYQFMPTYSLLLGAETGTLKADIGSGLETVGGRSTIRQSAAWVGVEKMINDQLWLNGRAGYHNAGGGIAERPLLHGGAEFRPNDTLTASYDFHYDLYAVSPLSASKNIRLADNQLQGTWNIQRGTSVYAKANYGFFSDDNRYWTVLAAPRQNIVQTQKFNADIGVSAQASGFSKNLNNGYYDPRTYQQYLVTLGASYWFDSDDMVGVTGGLGKNRDNTMSSFENSNNYAFEGNFGLYKDWMLNLHAGRADSIGINSAHYSINSYTAALTSRF
jgi:tetratricopeptide (TPR) repeat protein